ncbi:sulfatase-like hydrolase/transferase [Oceanicoccus sagamiensis]|uniref:Sulfatase n=1 Tax=Oceanicoccus sagamiensis TaxID=716816 RepID=A0A1X9NI91_9GAMM|nr:sulfatase-like hydrolase/transferase [Oceanicoccus sagamiensis]ARN75229.1 sulfatase [Oceanicoccus sagamiensis]
MKKLLAVILVLATVALAGWQNRLNLLLWAGPKIRAATSTIEPNKPVVWPKGPATAAQTAAERPPNIILILTDDMGFNDISLYNGGAADGSLQTPNIDKLAQQGIRFNNGYAANAVCSTSRASLLTGRYSTRFGLEYTPIFKTGVRIFNWMEELNPSTPPVLVNMDIAAALPTIDDLGMPSEEITIGEVLQQQGYYTAHIGKWHLGSIGDMRPENQGFDDSLYMKGVFYLPPDHPEAVNAKIPNNAIDNMVWAMGSYEVQWNDSTPFEPKGYLTDYFTDAAIDVIEANRNRPFFLYLAHWGPHNPVQASREDYDALSHIKDHRLRTYAAMLRALDRSVEEIAASLEENGLSDNTLIIFTSDNGGAGYLGLPELNKPYRGWKLTHFEGGTHVPFMAKWPAQIEAGLVSDEAIHHIDLFHTIAAAAGASVPTDRKLDGVNLLPFIKGEQTGAPHKTLFWHTGHQQTVWHKGWKMIRAEQSDKPGTDPIVFLFDLNNDPTEQHNLLTQQPEKAAELTALLDAHHAEQAESLWESALNAPQLIDKPTNKSYQEGDTYLYWPN